MSVTKLAQDRGILLDNRHSGRRPEQIFRVRQRTTHVGPIDFEGPELLLVVLPVMRHAAYLGCELIAPRSMNSPFTQSSAVLEIKLRLGCLLGRQITQGFCRPTISMVIRRCV